jgi:hypothetical protein
MHESLKPGLRASKGKALQKNEHVWGKKEKIKAGNISGNWD